MTDRCGYTKLYVRLNVCIHFDVNVLMLRNIDHATNIIEFNQKYEIFARKVIKNCMPAKNAVNNIIQDVPNMFSLFQTELRVI